MSEDDYYRHQKSFDVKVGDTVTVFGKPACIEDWPCPWVPEMNQAIGKSGIVLQVKESGILVKIPGISGSIYQKGAWYYPYTALNIIR